jgi:tetratricopeptide (TPR) repeat protein
MAAAKGPGPGKPPKVDTDELLKRWEADKKSRIFLQLADEYRKQDQIDAALGILREGLKHHATFLPARVVLARCLLAKGQLAQAQAELEPIVKKAPDNLLAGKLLAEVLEERGEGQRALAILNAMLPFAIDDPEVAQRVADLEARLTPPITGDGGASDTAEFRAHDSTRPLEVATSVPDSSPPPAPSRPVLVEEPRAEEDPFGDVLAGDGDGDDSPPGMADVLVIPVPAEPVPAELLGSTRGEAGSLADNGEDEFASLTLAELYESQGAASEAAAIYARLLARRPDDAAIRRSLERCQARMAGTDVAASIIESVAAPAPTLSRPRWEPVRPRAVQPVAEALVAAPEPLGGLSAESEGISVVPAAGGRPRRQPSMLPPMASRRTLRELHRWLKAVAAVRQ